MLRQLMEGYVTQMMLLPISRIKFHFGCELVCEILVLKGLGDGLVTDLADENTVRDTALVFDLLNGCHTTLQ